MKIAFVLGQFPALSETFILNQITGLIDRGHAISIFAERRSSDAKMHPDVAKYNLLDRTRYELLPTVPKRLLQFATVWKPNLIGLRSLNIARYGMEAASLRHVWSANLFEGAPDFDIVQCHFGALGRKAVLMREIGVLKGRIVTAFHGEDITNYPRRYLSNIYKPLFAMGDLFQPISDRWNKELLAMGCPAERIIPHRMGVDITKFPPVRSARADAGRLRILSVTRLVAKKGIGDALHAVARIPGNYEYIIAGDGPLRDGLQASAVALGIADKVRFLGEQSQDEITALLQTGDIFLAPSVTDADGDIEGLPVSIMEAMACGLPVISTWHSGIPELVRDGVSGFLVSEHDIEGLSDRLAKLAASRPLRAQLGEAGRQIVGRDFNIALLNARLEEVYGELIASVSRFDVRPG